MSNKTEPTKARKVKVDSRYDPEERAKLKEHALQTARTERKLQLFDFMERAVRYSNEAHRYGLESIDVRPRMQEDRSTVYFAISFVYLPEGGIGADYDAELHVDSEDWELREVEDLLNSREEELRAQKDRAQLKHKVLSGLNDEEREALGFGNWQER